ncbi:carbonic anhydrase [Aphanothece hegewaldii CCALA 016]|uniref:Carbonic anhydrase n=1 Tax=Aphanothece hegewaldii CCALA 016 TaxID=2107694 RepID=A0A2T1LUH8_9CHRO|nr:carbonic anhydrase [Aphanothece hegewaldii]PSF35192.1 carbonic anhydrase [Aphanothece hegewaldii CCALA 016]
MNTTCNCHRRWFLRSLLSASILLPSLSFSRSAFSLPIQPKALVLTCIDYRFFDGEQTFLKEKNLKNQYDWTALAGASLALTGFPHDEDAVAFWDQLALSEQLHHIQKVIIIDHQDCGAYAKKIDTNLSKDPEREKQIHRQYLTKASQEILSRYPQLEIEMYLATLAGEFIEILPN